jgi:phosphoribosyl 1,2-cyclic phosphate phosphodiesterase
MRVTFLGTGTSHGIPVIGCTCAVCRSNDPRNQRLRPSVLLETDTTTVLIDATPDFRTQALRSHLQKLDAVVVTHTHADHIMGLDDLRVFTEQAGRPMPIYGSLQTSEDLRRIFPYACTDKPKWPSLPSFDLRVIEAGQEFAIGDLPWMAVELPHGWMNVFGYIVGGQFAYLTDCNAVPPEVVKRIKGVRVLVLDALRNRPHPTHLTMKQAVEIAGDAQAGMTYLTHLCHEIEHRETEAKLPANVKIAYDDLQIDL